MEKTRREIADASMKVLREAYDMPALRSLIDAIAGAHIALLSGNASGLTYSVDLAGIRAELEDLVEDVIFDLEVQACAECGAMTTGNAMYQSEDGECLCEDHAPRQVDVYHDAVDRQLEQGASL